MLRSIVCGFIGADAEFHSENGREFTTFRVAHTERWKDESGNAHDSTQWVDVILSGKPNVFDYLKVGTLVSVTGHLRTRVYSSERARGFVAGLTISAVNVELLGGKPDQVPAQLFDANGKMHVVAKYYHTDCPGEVLKNSRGKEFVVDNNGWVVPIEVMLQQTAANDVENAVTTQEVGGDAKSVKQKNSKK